MIEADGWGWRYSRASGPAARGITLRIERGERVLLLGASGAGKSTFLAGLAGLLSPDEGSETGRLLLDGKHPSRQRGRVGMVLQDPDSQVVLAHLGDDAAFGAENLGVPRTEIWPRVRASLDAVGLDLPLDHPTAALSGGQKQRLAIAAALTMQSDADGVLCLDEPTANLDPAGIEDVRDAVSRATADRRLTLVVVEHRVDIWLDVVDRIIVLGPDGVMADGRPDDVLAAQRDELLDAGVWVPGAPLPVAPRTVPAPGSPILRTLDLTTGYDKNKPVGRHLDVAIPQGLSTVITGPNGAGKSTLALTMAGLLPSLSGRVEAAETLRPDTRRPDPQQWRSKELLTRVGTVCQSPEHQFVERTVARELAVGLKALRWSEAATASRVEELLALLHLTHLADQTPFALSGGEARRLSVGTVLATSPAVIVLDEPTFGQDRRTWTDLVRLVQDILAEGRTLISVTHDPAYLAVLDEHRVALEPLDG